MSKVYVLGSIVGQGKTTTAVALAEYFRNQGLKVANLQSMKGRFDAGHYMKNDCYHYTLPFEAVQSRESLANWLPKGYDVHIIEVTFAYGPVGAAYIDAFEQVNEIISTEHREDWEEYIHKYLLDWYPCSNIWKFWDIFHARHVQPIITKTGGDIGIPCVDANHVIHHADQFAFEEIEPMMVLSRSKKKAIAVGTFPAEFWDIYPDLRWYRYNYPGFSEAMNSDSYDIAVIGGCGDESLKLNLPATEKPVICYQPSVLSDRTPFEYRRRRKGIDYKAIFNTIRKMPVGTQLGPSDSFYSRYSNRFWVWQGYNGADVLEKEENVLFCNGWVLPQYLLREGLLEV